MSMMGSSPFRLDLFLKRLLSLCLAAFSANSFATAAYDASKALPKVVVNKSSTCATPFNFSETYYGAQSSTPPAVTQTGIGGNSTQGPILQLQFGSSTPANATPPIPPSCDGYYEITFSIQLRNDSGLNCHDGLNSIAVWVTSTDPSMPNVYGCPTRYYDFSWGGPNTAYQLSPNGNYDVPYACATFSNWVQCAWGSNYWNGGLLGCCGGYSIKAYPLFMYTNNWAPDNSNSVYKNLSNWGVIHMEPYGGFCNGYDSQWGGAGYCTLNNSYQSVNRYPTAYCSLKPFYFKTVVYLHAGATVSPPALQGLLAQEPYPQAGFNGGVYQSCGMSVVGGKFSVNYLHS